MLVNIFGGLMQTDKVIATLENAIRYKNISKPLVMRIKGNSSEAALDMSLDWKK